VREPLEFALYGLGASVYVLYRVARDCARKLRHWFQRHIYFRSAPFRSVQGPYVLVLRSFSNRMAIGRRIRRIVFDSTGRPIDMLELSRDPQVRLKREGLEGLLGRRLDLGEPRPDLTLLTFLGEARHQHELPFVGVSNGSSLGGVLRLVHAPDDLWFEAMKALAVHARAILIVPDDSPSLVREVEHVMKLHASKAAFLMPPSDTTLEVRRDINKVYQFEGLDLTSAWGDARDALRAAGVILPDYNRDGGILRSHPDGSLCEVTWPWNIAALSLLIDRFGKGSAGDARLARRALRRVGLRLLRYPSPPGSTMDEAWYQRQFAEAFHIRHADERRRLALAAPWLHLDRADHVMAAPLPGAHRQPLSPLVVTRCHRCPPDMP